MIRGNRFGRLALFFIMGIVFFVVTGCVGASRGRIRFDELRYPASMSAYLYGPNNELLAKDRELAVIKRFSYGKKFWGTFYSLVPLSGAKDISKQINKEIEDSGGEGIINVKVTSEAGFMNYVHPLTLLFIWPTFTKVTIEGDIVKYEPLSRR